MPGPIKSKDFGPLTLAAPKVEEDFKELERLSLALGEFTQRGEARLEHGKKLLTQFSEIGLRVGEDMQALAKELDEGRQRAETATNKVALAAASIQNRQKEQLSISDRFQALAGRMQEISSSLAEAGKDKALLRAHLPELEQKLTSLSDDALEISEEARNAQFKDLARDADLMSQSLRATRQKIKTLAETDLDPRLLDEEPL